MPVSSHRWSPRKRTHVVAGHPPECCRHFRSPSCSGEKELSRRFLWRSDLLLKMIVLGHHPSESWVTTVTRTHLSSECERPRPKNGVIIRWAMTCLTPSKKYNTYFSRTGSKRNRLVTTPTGFVPHMVNGSTYK